MKTFVDREVLLQVKRVYSKDEVVCELNRQLKESNFKIGVLESQVAELEDEFSFLRIENKTLKDCNNTLNLKNKHLIEENKILSSYSEEDKKNQYSQNLEHQIKCLQRKNNQLKNQVTEYINKNAWLGLQLQNK